MMHAEAPQHQTLQGAPALRTPQRLVVECHVDGAECGVMATVMSALAGLCGNGSADEPTMRERLGQSVAEARRCLPCNHCRAATVAAAKISRTRLGRRERDLFVRAAPAESNAGELVCDAAEPRAVKEAKMRAARKLAKAGLVWTGRRSVKVKRRVWWAEDLTEGVDVHVVVAGLTPLGAEIKKRFLSELQQGRALRWDGRVAESASAAQQDGSSLLARLEQGLREEESYLKQIIALVMSANPPGLETT